MYYLISNCLCLLYNSVYLTKSHAQVSLLFTCLLPGDAMSAADAVAADADAVDDGDVFVDSLRGGDSSGKQAVLPRCSTDDVVTSQWHIFRHRRRHTGRQPRPLAMRLRPEFHTRHTHS